MSDFNNNNIDTTSGGAGNQPIMPHQHQHHNSSDPLPGARGGNPSVDYSPENIDRTEFGSGSEGFAGTQRSGNWENPARQEYRQSDLDNNTTQSTDKYETPRGGTGYDNTSTERPMHAQPSSHEGVSIPQDNTSEGTKPSFGDKILGKTQQVTGKMTRKPAMEEKGEVRATGGKAALEDNSRLPPF